MGALHNVPGEADRAPRRSPSSLIALGLGALWGRALRASRWTQPTDSRDQ